MTNFGHVPAQVDKHLDVIRFWKDGSLFLGASNLTARYWTGTVWCFNDPDTAPEVEKCVTGREVEGGICDAVTLENGLVAVGLDSGGLEFMHLKDDDGYKIFNTTAYSNEHDNMVTSLSSNADNKRIVTGGADACVKVWDVESYAATNTYRYAHADMIWSIAYHSFDLDVFASCSQDGRTLVWDSRIPRPATHVDTGLQERIPTALAWSPEHNNVLAVGDDTGRIVLRDIRSPLQDTSTIKPHNRTVFKLHFSLESPNLLATCSDETLVTVIDCSTSNLNIVYKNDNHDDMIRGLAWKPASSRLYTCGWDKRIIGHDVTSNHQ